MPEDTRAGGAEPSPQESPGMKASGWRAEPPSSSKASPALPSFPLQVCTRGAPKQPHPGRTRKTPGQRNPSCRGAGPAPHGG